MNRVTRINNVTDDVPELLKAALDATADGIIITDTKACIKWMNPAFEKLTGYSYDEIINKNPSVLKSGKQDQNYYHELWDTISAGNIWHGELWNKKKDGDLYLEEQSITPVKNDEGIVTHYIAIKRDITKQHQLENELQMAKRIEAIGQLTAGVAHNFNNKLASILGFTDLALDEVKQYNNDELADYLQEVMIAGKSARDLVKQMMAFSVNEVSEAKAVNVELIIRQATKMMASIFPAEINVLVDIEPVPEVILDSVRLHQMLMSLAVNACDAMEQHGQLRVRVKIECVDKINCNSCHDLISGEFLTISINDNGKGIDLGNIEKIFLPFFTTRQNEGGTGMGLSALHGMLHDMNGHVVVESIVDQYTEFKLLFNLDLIKVKTNNVSHDNGSSKTLKTKNNIKRVLVVDDEEAVADLMCEILEINGYQVIKETNSELAVKHITENPNEFDLLITDQSMPHLSGTELVKLVRLIRHDLPVILITGYDDSRIDNENINIILNKPFDTHELLQKIASLSVE